MGKHLKLKKSDFESEKYDHRPGCMAGMLHVLDHHHWRNKHGRRKQPLCWRKPRTMSIELDTGEIQPFLDSEADRFQLEKHSTEPRPKRGKMKTLTIEENSKGERRKKKINKDFTHEQVKEYVEVLEILNINKEIFIKILKNPDVGIAKQFHVKRTHSRLIKSGSFPISGSSRSHYLWPTTLEHKQKECWSFPSRENLLFTINLPKLDSSESQNDHYASTGSSHEQKPSFSSDGLSEESGNHGFNHMVLNGLKDIKKWIKNALKERKKKKKDTPSSSIHETRVSGLVSDVDPSEKEIQPMERTSSLNDSLDRYSQLFEHSFRREVKLHSKSLKLVTEDNKSASSKANQPRFFRRISSLSGLESFGSFLTELSRDTFSSEMEIRKSVDYGTTMGSDKAEFQKNVSDEMETRGSVDFSEGQFARTSVKDVIRVSEVAETTVASEEEDRSSSKDQESGSRSPDREILQQSSFLVPETCSSDNIAENTEILMSEGSDLVSWEIHTGGHDSSLDIQNKLQRDDPQDLSKEKKQESCEYNRNNRTDKEDDIRLAYVKNILEISGFLTNKDLGEKWHSEDQPLNPSLLNKLEPHIHDELNNHQQLLFDAVNEAIVEIYDRTCTYFPRTLSFSRRICLMPKGQHLLDQVCGRIRWKIIGSTAKVDRSLDDLVACDLEKGGDGWMNLEMEAEWSAVDIEDMIFDELLDELIC